MSVSIVMDLVILGVNILVQNTFLSINKKNAGVAAAKGDLHVGRAADWVIQNVEDAAAKEKYRVPSATEQESIRLL